jgi:hypothetical protein
MSELEQPVQYVAHADSRVDPGGVFFFTGCFKWKWDLVGAVSSCRALLDA